MPRKALGTAVPCLTWILVLAGAAFSHAAWNGNGNAVCAWPGAQETPCMVSLGADGVMFFWADRRDGHFDIYAQRLDAHGQPQWTLGGIKICGAPYDQQFPAAVSDGAGGAIVVWQDGRLGDDGVDLYAQRITASGSVLWQADGVPIFTHVVSETPAAAFAQVIVSDSSGGAIVAWRDTRTDIELGNTEIYAQKISSTGATQWTLNGIKVLGFPLGSTWPTRNLVMVDDGAGGAIIVWQDGRNAAYTANDLYTQRISSDGQPAWTANGVLLCDAPGDQGYQDVAALPNGEAAIVWEDKRGGNYDIYAQRLSASGTPAWAANGVTVVSAPNDQRTPRIVVTGPGSLVIAWSDGRTSPAAPDVYAQRLDSSGATQWPSGGVQVCGAAGWQGRIRMCGSNSGAALLTWMDNRIDPSGATLYYDIYAQMIDASGVVQWTADGLVVTAASGTQRLQQALSDGAGGAYVVWEDNRNLGDWDIYAQRMVPDSPVVPVSSIPDARSRNDGTTVRLPARVVTGAFDGYFYIEEPGRYSAIRIISDQPVSLGDNVIVEGSLGTSCERYITATSVILDGTGQVPTPLGLPLARLRAPAGLDNTGLLVRTCGEVTSVSPEPTTWFTVRDGAVQAVVRATATVSIGDYVSVTGICSCDEAGVTVLTRSPADVRVIR